MTAIDLHPGQRPCDVEEPYDEGLRLDRSIRQPFYVPRDLSGVLIRPAPTYWQRQRARRQRRIFVALMLATSAVIVGASLAGLWP